MRIVVTGGCGFIGSAVVRALAERGDRVLNIDRRRKAVAIPALDSVNGREGYARLEANIGDRALMRAIFNEFKPEAVIHLATPQGDEPAEMFDVGLAGTFSILEACRGLMDRIGAEASDRFRLVHAVSRESFIAPSERQAIDASAASLMSEWTRCHDIPLVACSADAVFGPWQGEAALIPGLVASLMNGQPHVLEAAGERVRDWLPLRDFADGIVRAATKGEAGASYEFTVGAERRDLDIAEAACTMLDDRYPAPASWAGLVQLDGEPEEAAPPPFLDASAAEAALDWRPLGFHAGLERALVWALDRYKPAEALQKIAAE